MSTFISSHCLFSYFLRLELIDYRYLIPQLRAMYSLSRPHDVSVLAASKTYANEKDWNRMQPIITKLYRDENKSLRQVREIMESQYHFYAT